MTSLAGKPQSRDQEKAATSRFAPTTRARAELYGRSKTVGCALA